MRITDTLKNKTIKGKLQEINIGRISDIGFNMEDTYISYDGCGSWTLICNELALNENAFNTKRKPYKIDMVTHFNNNSVYKLEDKEKRSSVMGKYNLKQMIKDGYVKDFSETMKAYKHDTIDCKVEKLSNMRKIAERS